MRLRYLLLLIWLLLYIEPALAHSGEAEPLREEVMAGWANLIGFGLIISSLVFTQFVSPLVSSSVLKRGTFIVGWLLLGVGGLFAVLMWSTLYYLTPIELFSDVSIEVVGGTFAPLWIIRTLAWLTLGVLWFYRPFPHLERLLILLSLIVMLISGIYLHDSTSNDPLVYLVIESVRQMSTGMLLAAMMLLSFDMRRIPLPKVLSYFRPVVLILLISTTALGWQDVDSLSALPYTIHGQVFLIQAFSLYPLLDWSFHEHKKFEGLKKTLIEGVLIGGTLLFFSLIAITNPSQGKITWNDYVLIQNPVYDVYQDDEMLAQISMVPGLAGENELYIVLVNAQDGTHIDDTQVSVEARLDSGTTASFELEPASDGVYQDLVANFNEAGMWQISVNIDRPENNRKTVNFAVNLPSFPKPSDSELERGSLWQVGAIIACGVTGIIFLGITAALFRQSPDRRKILISPRQIASLIFSIVLLCTATLLLSSLA